MHIPIPVSRQVVSCVRVRRQSPKMQDSRKPVAIGAATVPLPSTARPATDFTIDAIMGRRADTDRPSPRLGVTADCVGSDDSSHHSAKALQMSAYLSSSATSPTSSPLKSEFISNYNSSPPLSPGSESADLSLNHHIRPPSSSSSVGRESRCSAATTTGDRSLSESPSCRSPSPTSSVKENGRADGKSEPNPCSEDNFGFTLTGLDLSQLTAELLFLETLAKVLNPWLY
ncbi:unnamed protein product [Oppiella nova]|uniref:Uncharacterized protein n=1 Tax=Oppiella nova TaxID=334625 RepID=A0A7R9Q9B3_9ACAR|nr:unnamed protein product [Oppiella nova]CAG2160118.1 unnamed protein product [Oppiella nova]